MRNLVVNEKNCRNVYNVFKNIETNQKLSECVICTVSLNNNDTYILFDGHLYVVTVESDNIIDIDIGQYSSSKIIAMEYCITLQELYCAYESGDIASINLMDPTSVDYKVIATFNEGLQCMKFSPDHELIAIVSSEGILNTMVLDCQILSEAYLYSDEFGQNQFVTAGWGKKETQFHGSEGKAAAQAKPEQLIPNEDDDGRIHITWREDGALFAISFLHKEMKIRQVKIFGRAGILYWTSEQINGLEACLAWKSFSNLIAVTQILKDKYEVAFFEKNGLKYSELLLPFKSQEMKVKDLLWSPCSDVLAIVCHESKRLSKTNNMLIQLWTENNCHWYLKQTLTFSMENPLLYATWSNTVDPNKKELIYMTTNELTFCSFNWYVNHSRGKTVDDKAVVGVIDGDKILVTSFRIGIIPPPMAHDSIKTDEAQNAIIFAPNIDNKISSISSNEFCTASCTNKLTFFQLAEDFSTYHIANLCSIDFSILNRTEDLSIKDNLYYYMHHFLWFTKDIMLFSIITEKHNLLCVLSLDKTNSENSLPIQKVHVLDYPIEHIISSSDGNTVYIKTKEYIFKYTRDGQFEQTNMILNKLCVQMEVTKINSKDVIFALSSEYKFLIDGKEIAKNITGFYIHNDFLLLTTLQHTLICVPLNEVGMQQLSKHDLTLKPWLMEVNEKSLRHIYIRRLEKDSRIIVAVSNDSRTILQMPRGNLECIQPRALSLNILKYHLDNCNYVIALDIMTKQRINLNLIYDHNPQLFLDNVNKFVEDIIEHNKINWLNLFLSELQNEDVIETMYANCYTDRDIKFDTGSNKTTVNKIDEVCKLLRCVMEKHEEANNLTQPILISLVKNQQRQGFENALTRIKQIKMEDAKKIVLRSSSVSAHEALKYLFHFVNIETLYDIALGMYDLEFALFIASKSSKDPKEYIPFLNNLNKLEENYMKYSINVYLKRYELALEFISKDLTKFEECLDFIRSQKLYKKALKLFGKNTEEHRKVAGVYGEFLLNEGNYQMAGTMFYRSGDLNKALKTFSISSNNWEDIIAISKEMKLSAIDLHELYKGLVKNLKAERKYEPAAIILKEYLNDVEEAVALLCEGRMWKHAIRIALDVQRSDLNETHIIPGVKEHAEHVILQLNKTKEDFLRYKSRLAVVRKEMKEAQLPREETYDESEINKEIPDSISDISSIADSTSSRISRISISSGKSYRSSKNRRKQVRKLLSLKEGSTFEDISLIHALYQIMINTYKDGDEWYKLVQVLYRFKFDESAEKIIIEGKECLQLMESKKSEIWDKTPTSLDLLMEKQNMTTAQFQEIIASIKPIEHCIKTPPPIEPPFLPNYF
ncbi:putative elongator complex protein 1 [Monomorium pharaonis]|uniref:putative elongator complex protein 1 n=1 Tax=Monomorium pharaonis TaxID=307658 RepID=UPI00063FC0F9|nr:putative elongator complex protein 1 [Monomorium pharaonis]XP_012536299.1 putative elongator complex protein 1 [Monomorium pharaonis]XP_012536300.1 putative elongator complex protein 1 [Monomorium pharaonis]XP_028048860.1 putative elongator complex protein 1 [Monomorium pharaonis]XP_028048863.1 putative elongator complex protein 1 [Monomorium pharaonis]XP_028048865.1 putative elongator complex protein 1 [Monomorium pharaonis]XP_028048870.1 putative elongator complex protein 1 [Monomorium p